MPSERTRSLVTAALLAALLSAAAYVAVPVQPVPFTLQVFVVLLAALLLPPGWAAAAVGAYVLLGASGVPVFSGPSGGLGVLFGPRGGYLLGFLVAAGVGAAVRRSLGGRTAPVADAAACITGLVAIYLPGWAVLMAVTGMTPAAAFTAGVIPFVLFDAIKALAAIAVASAVRRAVPGRGAPER